MKEYLIIFLATVLINNLVLTKFLGFCIFFGVSKKLDTAFGMGIAVTFVMVSSSIILWPIWNFVLIPLHLEFIKVICFIVVIASFVQLVEILVKRFSPVLYRNWGVYLVLIASNCIVFGVPLIMVEEKYDFIGAVINALGCGVGFTLAIALLSSMRERLDVANIPESLKGLPISFIIAGLLAISFMGFQGLISL